MYDMGMARVFLDDEGHHRPPRSHAGMRGTEEWSSLNAEIGRDQWYLRTLGRDDTPDYFYLATILQESTGQVKKTQKPESVSYKKAMTEISLLEREFF
uniref:Transposase n=1 Tax=Angiostrongylus cantonensis TaxID=6313 RepID=A0A158P8U7_ANGCA